MNRWYTLSLFFHVLALALWLGGMTFFLIVFAPAVNELEAGAGIRALNRGRISLELISWPAIGLLLLTGVINVILRYQMTGGGQSGIYLTILAIKLFLFLAMLVHQCLQAFKYAPQIAALTAQTAGETTAWPEPLRSLWQKWFLLLKINAGLAPVVTLLGLALLES